MSLVISLNSPGVVMSLDGKLQQARAWAISPDMFLAVILSLVARHFLLIPDRVGGVNLALVQWNNMHGGKIDHSFCECFVYYLEPEECGEWLSCILQAYPGQTDPIA